jgi:hypothetical protein
MPHSVPVIQVGHRDVGGITGPAICLYPFEEAQVWVVWCPDLAERRALRLFTKQVREPEARPRQDGSDDRSGAGLLEAQRRHADAA